MVGKCSICKRLTFLFYKTPADPPFFPAEGGRHCGSCQQWLLKGGK